MLSITSCGCASIREASQRIGNNVLTRNRLRYDRHTISLASCLGSAACENSRQLRTCPDHRCSIEGPKSKQPHMKRILSVHHMHVNAICNFDCSQFLTFTWKRRWLPLDTGTCLLAKNDDWALARNNVRATGGSCIARRVRLPASGGIDTDSVLSCPVIAGCNASTSIPKTPCGLSRSDKATLL